MKNKDWIIDHETSIVNFANSILKHFKASTFHNSIPWIDDILQGHKRVAVFLFDGLGEYLINLHLPNNSFIKSHINGTIRATFPPTTVASTTGFLSAKFPIENGWLGWALYFNEYNSNIDVFSSRYSNSKALADNIDIMRKYCPYERLDILLKTSSLKVDTAIIFPYPIQENGPKSLSGCYKKAASFFKKKEYAFLYNYWTYPDSLIHMYGVNSKRVHNNIVKIDKMIKKFVTNNPDVLVFTIADHGLVDVAYFDIVSNKSLLDTLSKPISIEARTTAFFVQKGKEREFEKIFNQSYGSYFVLLSKNEVIEQKLFGDGNPNQYSYKFIGDYVAVAIDKYCLTNSSDYDEKSIPFKGHHAGMSKEEMNISVGVFNHYCKR